MFVSLLNGCFYCVTIKCCRHTEETEEYIQTACLVHLRCVGRVNGVERHVSVQGWSAQMAVSGEVPQRRWLVPAGHHELALHVEVVQQVFQRFDPSPSRLQLSESEAELDDVDHVVFVQHEVAHQEVAAVQEGF